MALVTANVGAAASCRFANRPVGSGDPFALLAFALLLSTALFSGESNEIKESKDSFKSGEETITVDKYEPAREGKHPVVIMLHGAEGTSFGGGFYYKRGAQELARNGYVVLFIHYFERTKDKFTFGDLLRTVKNFEPWMRTVGDAITYAEKLPNADARRIGLYGVSQGAFLSLSVATKDERIKAVVEYFGGLPIWFMEGVKKMPPVLILHGERDFIVSVKEAHKLEAFLKELKSPYEIKLYPDQGHGFLGADNLDAQKRVIDFLNKHLAGKKENR